MPGPITAATQALCSSYGVEGFLRRLAASEYASKMTLKGGMLMAAISARRMTKHADLSTRGVGSEEERVAAVVGEIIATELDVDDGLEFDADSVRTEVMREDAEYQGVRVKLIARLATARTTTTLDFSFGDPHQSTVIELPELLGTGTIRLASYPPEMSLAEKVATMMSRRELNTRDRDFADVWVFSRVRAFDAAELRSAITSVAEHRNHEIVPLSVALENMPDRQTSYTAMLDRMAYQRLPPASWTECSPRCARSSTPSSTRNRKRSTRGTQSPGAGRRRANDGEGVDDRLALVVNPAVLLSCTTSSTDGGVSKSPSPPDRTTGSASTRSSSSSCSSTSSSSTSSPSPPGLGRLRCVVDGSGPGCAAAQ